MKRKLAALLVVFFAAIAAAAALLASGALVGGAAIYNLGVFSTTAKTSSNFDLIRPADWAMTASGLTVVWRNFGADAVRYVEITYSGDCTGAGDFSPASNATFAPASDYTDAVESCTCKKGAGYTVNANISYASGAGVTHSESGTIHGPCE